MSRIEIVKSKLCQTILTTVEGSGFMRSHVQIRSNSALILATQLIHSCQQVCADNNYADQHRKKKLNCQTPLKKYKPAENSHHNKLHWSVYTI